MGNDQLEGMAREGAEAAKLTAAEAAAAAVRQEP